MSATTLSLLVDLPAVDAYDRLVEYDYRYSISCANAPERAIAWSPGDNPDGPPSIRVFAIDDEHSRLELTHGADDISQTRRYRQYLDNYKVYAEARRHAAALVPAEERRRAA